MSAIDSAVELWGRLVTAGFIRPMDYDLDLVSEMRRDLGIAPSETWDDALEGQTAKRLIDSLLGAIQPVAASMAELLALYERIEANQADADNLRVRYDFDEDTPPLEFDLASFREWEERYSEITTRYRTRRWEQGPAWDLVGALRAAVGANGNEGEGETLLPRVPRDRDNWTPLDTQAPTSGSQALDQVIADVWELREEFLEVATRTWPERGDYASAIQATAGSVQQMSIMVSDFWPEAVADACSALCRQAAGGVITGAQVLTVATRLRSELDRAVARLPAATVEVEETIAELLSILSLPMWGRRHELYSAWVFTQVVSAIGFDRLTFLVHNGRLSFDFGGSQLARFETVDGVAEVWAELRTPHEAPVGKGRKAAIQPDYSLTYQPVSDPSTTFLAIECKQYKRSAFRTHADAIADYTSGLPNAHVLLAAYGPISSKVEDGLDTQSRPRAEVHRYLRPGQKTSLDAFQATVARHIPEAPIARRLTPSSIAIPRMGDVMVQLTWTEPGVDLDLHADRLDGEHVSYARLVSSDARGAVTLSEDIRDAPGPEVLRITGEAEADVYVVAYTAHDVTSVGARLRIVTGEHELTLPVSTFDDQHRPRWRAGLSVRRSHIEILVADEVIQPKGH